MAYEIRRHPLVREDLFSITILIGEYAGYDIAESKIEQIEKKLNSLTDFPYIGTTRDDIHPGLRAIPAAEKAVICSASMKRQPSLTSSASAMRALIGEIG
ncbi:type II toxin-antitoxin system RelE/ParE family toxin [Rhizobium sp. NPDC090279]|uniref:type II toxin-antitoxin system RelE/ParE family toxin n=1 Tax=Rhizobium sp. NPDC090279 TaxID=3364499 RepID=UPI003839D15C